MRLLYFDCIAGISGDMALGALVDAGAEPDAVRSALASLPLEPFSVEFDDVDAGGMRATRAVVRCEAAGVIRTYASIRALLDGAQLPDAPRELAQRIFHRLAIAEARIHRRDIEQVTFHEVGAVDSVVDIVGTAVALSMLRVDRAFASAIPTGLGMTRTEHGAMPIPAPAVVELLRGAPLYSRGVAHELTTPTGAAILATVVEGFGEIPAMRIEAAGYGAGTRTLGFPNVLRVLVGEEAAVAPRREAATADETSELVLEANVDDLAPEIASYVVERLLAAGAQDAWLTPIVMKKGRPGVTVSVLCSRRDESAMRDLLFREAGTLGVRATPVSKHALDRDTIAVATPNGTVRVKIGYLDGRAVTVAPEYEDCAEIARATGEAVRDVYVEAAREARAGLAGEPPDEPRAGA
jgi:pyridinium-3,5-bisthiocarboxylic acid mononucleotide nickel chelatase